MNLADIKTKSEIAGNVLVPFVIAVVGFFVTDAMKKKEVAVSYVNIAAGILEHEGNDKVLRDWAIKVIDHYSEVKLSPEATTSLEGHAIVISGAGASLECVDQSSGSGVTKP